MLDTANAERVCSRMATIEFPALAQSGDQTPPEKPVEEPPPPDRPLRPANGDAGNEEPADSGASEPPGEQAGGELAEGGALPPNHEDRDGPEDGDPGDQARTQRRLEESSAEDATLDTLPDERELDLPPAEDGAMDAPSTEVLLVETAVCPFCGAPSEADRPFCATCGQPGAPLAEGTLLHGQYRIGGPLAVSNTGAVYTGRDEKHKRDIAVKELLAPPGGSAEARTSLGERFRHESRRLAHLKHSCLPEILDHFQADGRFYVVMPLLPTQSLQVTMIQRGRGWSEQEVRRWAVSLLELLDYLEHRHPPVVHGEVWPEHLILKDDGTPCLISYGLAPRLGLRPSVALPGQVAAPAPDPAGANKKRAKERAVEPAATQRAAATPLDDLYAVGATLHALLTGRDVFAGAEESGSPFPPVRTFNPRISVGMAEAVGDAVAEDPHRRFLSAGAMRAHLLQQGVGAAPSAAGEGRSPVPFLVLVVLVLALVAGVLLYAHENAGTTSPGATTEGQHEVNPLVAAAPVPTASGTVRFSDTFTSPSIRWPGTGAGAYEQGGLLWLADRQGAIPLKVTRVAYATGPAGFALRATVRLAEGPIDVPFGLVAADHGSSSAENVSLLIRAGGQWALLRYHGGLAIPLVNWRANSAVRTGHNAPNELRLTLHGGVYTVIINGRKVAASIPAGADSAGRVGLVAWPGAVVACDGIEVDPSPPVGGLEEDFLDNHRGWVASSAGAPLFHGGMLRLRAAAGQAWRLAATARASAPAGASAFSAEAMLRASGGSGGMVFARGVHDTLAVVVGSDGGARVVRLGPGDTRTVMGPIPSPRIRTGYGLNLVRLLISDTHGTIHAQLVVNGGTVLRYAVPAKGLRPAVALAAVGPGTTVSFSVLRIAR